MSRSTATAPDHAPMSPLSTSDCDAVLECLPSFAPATRRMPAFSLAEEARRVDEARRLEEERRVSEPSLDTDEDATVTVGAEEHRKLLASAFAAFGAEPAPGRPNTDDEATLDAPSPGVSAQMIASLGMARAAPARVTARPPALRALVLTPPPAPKAGVHPGVSPAAVLTLLPRTTPVRMAAPLAHAAPVSASASASVAPQPAVVVAPVSGYRPKVTAEMARAARQARLDEERRLHGLAFAPRTPERNAETLVVAGIWAMALSLIAVLMIMATSA